MEETIFSDTILRMDRLCVLPFMLEIKVGQGVELHG